MIRSIEEFTARIPGPTTPNGSNGANVCCPIHGDTVPSCQVRIENGSLAIHCKICGGQKGTEHQKDFFLRILEKWGIDLKEVFEDGGDDLRWSSDPHDGIIVRPGKRVRPEKTELTVRDQNEPKPGSKAFLDLDSAISSLMKGKTFPDGYQHTSNWIYRKDGEIVGAVARFDKIDGSDKTYRPFVKKENGWKYGTKITTLYRVDELEGRQEVFIVEGEKTADALWNVDIPATTASGGSSGFTDKVDTSPLIGKDLIFWCDNDKDGGGGDTHLHNLKKVFFEKIGADESPESVKIVDPKIAVVNKGDAYDVIESLRADGCNEPEEIKSEVLRMVEENHDVYTKEDFDLELLPEPSNLYVPSKPIQITSDMLPNAIRPFINDLCRRIDQPYEFAMASFMSGCAGLIGRKVIGKCANDLPYVSTAANWIVSIGESGSGKSPASAPFEEGVKTANSLMVQRTEPDVLRWIAKKLSAESAIKKLTAEAGKYAAALDWDGQKVKLEEIRKVQQNLPPEVKSHDMVSSSITLAALNKKQAMSPYGVYVIQDEIDGFLKDMNSDFQQAARASFNAGYDSTSGPECVDRSQEVRRFFNTVSFSGNITLVSFCRFLAESGEADGFPQRIQPILHDPAAKCLAPDDDKESHNKSLSQDVNDFYSYLVEVPRDVLGVKQPLSTEQPGDEIEDHEFNYLMTATDEASEFFTDRIIPHYKQFLDMTNPDRASRYMRPLISKHQTKICKCAIIFQISDYGGGLINLNSLKKAVKFCDAVLSSQMCIEPMAGSLTLNNIFSVIELIDSRDLEKVTVTELFRELNIERRMANDILKTMVDENWLLIERGDRSNYFVNRRALNQYRAAKKKYRGHPEKITEYAFSLKYPDEVITDDSDCLTIDDIRTRVEHFRNDVAISNSEDVLEEARGMSNYSSEFSEENVWSPDVMSDSNNGRNGIKGNDHGDVDVDVDVSDDLFDY